MVTARKLAMFSVVLMGAAAALVNAQSVTGVTQPDANTVRCALSNGSAVDFQPANAYMVRVEYRQANASHKCGFTIDSAFTPSGAWTLTSLGTDPIVLTAANYSVSIPRTTFGIVFRNSGGTTLWSSTAVSQYTVNGTVITGNYYGVHAQTYMANTTNNLVTFGTGSLNIYDFAAIQEGGAITPILWTPRGFGILVDAEYGSFNMATTTTLNITRGTNNQNTNNLFFLMAGTPRQIMSSYYKATGPFPVPPPWTCGFMNSEWGLNETEYKTIINNYRSRNIPIDGYIFDYDWFNYNVTNDGDFKWNTGNWPSAGQNVQAWPVGSLLKHWSDSLGIKLIGIRKPHGIWGGSSTWGTCADFNQQNIRNIFWEHFVNPSWDSRLRGIIAFWNDEMDACNNYQTPYENYYMNQCLYWGQRYSATANTYHNQRYWSINRSYVGGAHRNAHTVWSGDIGSDNGNLQASRKYMLTTINVGAAWWSQDIGGFTGHPSNNDYQHWIQLGAWTPVFRVHGTNGEQRQPWVYGATAEAVAGNAIRLRYTFIPYIYSAYWKLRRDGIPLVRPLVMDYPADNNTAQLIESWMFGDDILVSPIVTNYTATTKTFYVPAGNWYNFWTDAAVTSAGANVTVSVTGMGDTLPILVKQGAVIPRCPTYQYINNYPLTQNNNYAVVPVTFHVYGGAGSTFDYTDDDGVTYDYETGEYRYIQYTHTSGTNDEQVVVGAKQGSYAPVDSNGYFVFHGIAWSPAVVSVQSGNIFSNRVAVAALNGTAAPAWAFDSLNRKVLIKVVTPFAPGIVRISQQTGIIANTVVKNFLEKTRITALKGRIVIHAIVAGQGGLTVRLMTAAGSVVKEYRFASMTQGEQTLTLPTEGLSRGVYFALLTTDGCKVLKKVVVTR